MLFETLFSSDDAPDLSELWAYAADPTVANARALLAALSLPTPYDRLRESKRRRDESASAPTARRSRGRGGAPGPPAQSSGLAAELVPAAIAIHERVDAIHDVYSTDYPMTQLTLSRILSADTDNAAAFANFPSLRSSLSDLVWQLKKPQTFTYNAFNALNSAFKLKFKDSGLGTLRSDRSLHAQVTRWRSNATTEIVLDGIVRSPDDPFLSRLNEPERTSQIARSQVLYAFIMLLLADYDPALAAPFMFQIDDDPPVTLPSPAETAAPSAVQFLVGPFQTMDVANWRTYMQRWTGAIRDAAPRIWKRIGFQEIAPPIRSASGAEVRESSVRLPNGTIVPFKASKRAAKSRSGPAKRGAAAFSQASAVSQPKSWLGSLFYEYNVVTDAQRAEMEPLIDNAIAVNALRDSVKADIALARGAVYVTYDRLAMMYYALRSAPESRGDGLWLHASGIGDAKLGVYE